MADFKKGDKVSLIPSGAIKRSSSKIRLGWKKMYKKYGYRKWEIISIQNNTLTLVGKVWFFFKKKILVNKKLVKPVK